MLGGDEPSPVVVALLVGVGGVVGAALRYGAGLVLGAPAGTLAVNVVGSFALGLLVAGGHRLDPRTRLALGGGLLSSFTTYSTFALETVTAPPPVAAGYVLASVALGLGAAAVAGALAGGFDAGGPDADAAADEGGERS